MKLHNPLGGDPLPDPAPKHHDTEHIGGNIQTTGDYLPGSTPTKEVEQATEVVHEFVSAAMSGRITLGRGPNPYDPTKMCVIAFGIHPEDVAKLKAGDPHARSCPLAIIFDEETLTKLRAQHEIKP